MSYLDKTTGRNGSLESAWACVRKYQAVFVFLSKEIIAFFWNARSAFSLLIRWVELKFFHPLRGEVKGRRAVVNN
jgi:hypothetical protein